MTIAKNRVTVKRAKKKMMRKFHKPRMVSLVKQVNIHAIILTEVLL